MSGSSSTRRRRGSGVWTRFSTATSPPAIGTRRALACNLGRTRHVGYNPISRSPPRAGAPSGISLSRRRVLAISSDLDQLRRIVANLERAGAEVDAVRSPDSVAESTLPHRYIFYAMGKNDRDSLESLLPRVRQRAHVAAIMPAARLTDLTGLLHDTRVNH